MLTHRYIDRICIGALCLALLLTLVFINGEKWGIQNGLRDPGYATRLLMPARYI